MHIKLFSKITSEKLKGEKMTKQEVLSVIIKLFKDENAVDPNLTDEEISAIKLKDIPLFEHELPGDPDFKKEVLFRKMVSALKKAHPNHIPPEISPNDYTVFNKSIGIGELAGQIAEDTPDQNL